MQTTTIWTLRKLICALALVALLSVVVTSAMNDYNTDAIFQDQMIDRLYGNYLKAKRSPSIGLSLAEYMAQPQGQGDLHFIENGRK